MQGHGHSAFSDHPTPSFAGTHVCLSPLVMVTLLATTGLPRTKPEDVAGPGAEAYNHLWKKVDPTAGDVGALQSPFIKVRRVIGCPSFPQ